MSSTSLASVTSVHVSSAAGITQKQPQTYRNTGARLCSGDTLLQKQAAGWTWLMPVLGCCYLLIQKLILFSRTCHYLRKTFQQVRLA